MLCILLKLTCIYQIFKDHYPYFLYGDQAYKLLAYIFSPYLGKALITSNQQYINKELSCIQMLVEHLFRLSYNLWSLNTYRAGLKLGLQSVAALFKVVILLTNCYTCMRKRIVVNSQYQIAPLTIQEYLQLPSKEQEILYFFSTTSIFSYSNYQSCLIYT